jgi:hypothetical protein
MTGALRFDCDVTKCADWILEAERALECQDHDRALERAEAARSSAEEAMRMCSEALDAVQLATTTLNDARAFIDVAKIEPYLDRAWSALKSNKYADALNAASLCRDMIEVAEVEEEPRLEVSMKSKDLKPGVYDVPREIDKEVAKMLEHNRETQHRPRRTQKTSLGWAGAVVGIVALSLFTTTVHYDSTLFNGKFGSGWSWDYNNLLAMLIGTVSSIIILGLKIQAGLAKVIQKQKIIATKDKKIKELGDAIAKRDTEIEVLKRVLDDRSATYSANAAALKNLEGADGLKVEVKPPCPQPPQPNPQPQ